MASIKIAATLLVLYFIGYSTTQEISIIKSIRECVKENHTVLCLKERALKIVDEAVFSDQPIPVNDYLEIVRESSYKVNLTEEDNLPRDVNERNEILNQLLAKRLDEFFESRTMQLKMAQIVKGIYNFIYSEIEAFYEGTTSIHIYKDMIEHYNDMFFDISKTISKLIPQCMLPTRQKTKHR